MRAVFLAASLVFSVPALAAEYEITSRAKIFEPSTLIPLLERGDLALVEAEGDQIKQTINFAVIEAPPERVYDMVMAVEQYPDFIRTIAETKILRQRDQQIMYRWKLQVPLITLKGVRMQRGRRPHVIEVRGAKGNFRQSRERWEFFPIDNGKKTLTAFYRTLDVETGGLVIETLSKLEPAFAQALSMASSFVHLQAVQRRAAGKKPLAPKARSGPVPPFRSLSQTSKVKDLGALMKLGQLALIESHEDGALRQVTMMTEVKAPRTRLVKILGTPDDFPKFIPNFAEQTSKRIDANHLELKWELEVPFVNLYGSSIMTVEDNGSVDVLNRGGDIPRGRYRWEFVSMGPDTTVPIHYAYSDVRKASFFTRKLIEKEPLFEHGAVIASTAVALTAVKARAEGRR